MDPDDHSPVVSLSTSSGEPQQPRLTSDRTSVYQFVLDEVGVQPGDSIPPGLGVGANAGSSVPLLDPSLNIPMRILMRLGYEVFDLGSPRHDSLRMQFAGILSRVITSTHGTSMNKKIVSQVDWLTSREQVVTYIKSFRDLMWPNGKTNASSPAAAENSSKTGEIPTRHPHSRVCARLVCKTRVNIHFSYI